MDPSVIRLLAEAATAVLQASELCDCDVALDCRKALEALQDAITAASTIPFICG